MLHYKLQVSAFTQRHSKHKYPNNLTCKHTVLLSTPITRPKKTFMVFLKAIFLFIFFTSRTHPQKMAPSDPSPMKRKHRLRD